MTIHNEAKKEEIAKNVIMPGDPLRAKYIAENYLDNYKLVNKVRNMYAYTGTYKGKEITVMASGMGMASIGIYSCELYKFYDVENIIRLGTCGGNNKDVKILDVIVADSSYTLSTFGQLFDGIMEKTIPASEKLNQIIINKANELNIPIKKGQIISTDIFDPYVDDVNKYRANYSNFDETLASEMEAYALFLMAKKYNKQAACILTVVDSLYDERVVSSEDREKSLDDAIKLTLETLIS